MAIVDGVTTVLPPPDGYVVDFDNPARTGVPSVYFVAGFMGALSLIFFGQRIYVKTALAGGLELDDFFIILAVATVFATSGFTLHMFATAIGGVHIWEISVDDFNRFLMDVYISAFLYPICGSAAKLSLLAFYLKLSPQQWFRVATWITIVFISGYTIGLVLPLIFSCTPMKMAWDFNTTGGKCINRTVVYLLIAILNIVSDIILFILPLPMVIKLHIPIRQKIGLVVIFGIGSLTIVTSIVRLAILSGMLTDPDATWVVGNASIWTQVEGYMMIMCATLPTMRKFFRHVAPKLLGESYASKSKTHEISHPPTRTLAPNSQSRRNRTQYSQFDLEEGEETETYIMGPVTGKNSSKVTSGNADDAVSWADSDSERAIVATTSPTGIVQTTVVTLDVEYTNEHEKRETGQNKAVIQ